MPKGQLPDEKVLSWGPLHDISNVHAFVGMIGICHMFICNLVHRVHHLVKLTRKEVPFKYGPNQIAVQDDLKQALTESPALQPLNYTSGATVILSINTLYIAVGYILGQCDAENPKLHYFARFGLITLNEREVRLSQPKLELYGLYRTLCTLHLYLIGLHNQVVEVDAKYIKGMLLNPNITPSVSIN
jgi:hypothetical protein